MIGIILLAFFSLLILSYYLFEKDLIAPCFLFILGYTISIFFNFINKDRWGSNISSDTFVVLIIGTLMFLIPSLLIKRSFNFKVTNFNNYDIDYSLFFVKIICCVQIVLLIAWVLYLNYLFNQWGLDGSFNEKMAHFRNWSSYTTSAVGNKAYSILGFVKACLFVTQYIFSYILVLRIYSNRLSKKDIWLLVSILISVIMMLLEGGRGGVVCLIITNMMFGLLLMHKKKGKIYVINRGTLIKLFYVFVGMCFIFYFSKYIVGRTDNIKFIDYISIYVGGQVELLDLFIKNPVPPSDIWGKETFHYLNQQLMRWGIIDYNPYIWHLEFRNSETGLPLGNSYPSFRSYLYDFGYWGIILLPLINAIIINYMYYDILYNQKQSISLLIIMYSFIFYTVFFDFSRSALFSGYFNFTIIKIVVLVWLYLLLLIPVYRKYNLAFIRRSICLLKEKYKS